MSGNKAARRDIRLAGVCGWPIHHSLSPVLHEYWLKKAGIRGAYVPFMVKPWEAFDAFKSLKYTSISGVNVTLPLKEHALRAADATTDDAQRVGAANCLYIREGRLYAHNTDMEGFSAPLLKQRPVDRLSQMTALIFGAGGASRAVIAALLDLGVPEIILINRTDEKAERICASAGLPSFYAMPWRARHDAIELADIVINSTSAGMSQYPALDIDLSSAKIGALIYDLVYTPEMTPLLNEARRYELDYIGGLSMLIEQARPSFRLFFGTEAPDGDPVRVLRRALASQSRRSVSTAQSSSFES